MLKLKNFSKNSFLTSWDIPVKVSPTVSVRKPKKTGKKQFSTGQVRKQASKQGIELPYQVAKKLAKPKQTKEQLYHKIYYQKQKQKEQRFRNLIKSQGSNYMVLVKRYLGLVNAEYERNPTAENLKKLHEAEGLIKQARLYDERYRPYWEQFKSDIKEQKIRLKKSRGAGNVSKPMITKAGTPMKEYVLNNYWDEVQEAMEESELSESEAVEVVFQKLVSDGTFEELKQIDYTNVLYGYWDKDKEEVISPI